MNSKRRADLHRKLSMGAVPRPPDGLAERIKADIPAYLRPDADRERFTWSVAFTMRVAASIILLITSAFVTLHLLEPDTQTAISLAAKQRRAKERPAPPQPAVERYLQRRAGETSSAPATEEVRLEISQDAMPAAAKVNAPRDASRNGLAGQKKAKTQEEDKDGLTVVAEAPARKDERERQALGATSGMFAPEPAPAMADAAPAPAAPPPPPMVAPPESRAMAQAGRMSAPAPAASSSLVTEALADHLSLAPRTNVFGISVDPQVFQNLKSTLERGSRPAATAVDLDAVINYFAGAPARAPRHDVSLEVEASPAPIRVDGDRAVIRVSVDTAAVALADRGSIPPVARDARIEIDINSNSVAHFRRIGGDEALSPEPALLRNVSVTALYELELKPRLQGSQRIATVRLRYRSTTDGRERVITRVIHGNDVAGKWTRASHRHRLASLGAVWGETLRESSGGAEVAERAAELASQDPADTRAKELANVASVTGGR